MSKQTTPASRRLTREERKQIAAAIERARRTDKRQLSAQQSIPYQRMYPDGVCRITDNYYTKTILFQDINYQLAQNEDKQTIFEGWCEFLNYFDASIHFQFTFFNTSAGADGYERSIRIAKTEGVSRMAVSASIERGLRQMEKWLKTTNPAFTNGKKLPI